MRDSIFHVGHDPSTGAVISVAGVAVLGIRAPYSPPILVVRKKSSMLSKTPADRVLTCAIARGPASDAKPWTQIMLGCALDELGRDAHPMAARDVAIPTPAYGLERHYFTLINAMYERSPTLLRYDPRGVFRVQYAQAALDAVLTYRPKIGGVSLSSPDNMSAPSAQAAEHPSSAWDDSRLRHGGIFGIVKEEPPPPPPPPEIARRPSAAWDDGRIRPPGGQLGIVKEEPPPPPPETTMVPAPHPGPPVHAAYHRWQLW